MAYQDVTATVPLKGMNSKGEAFMARRIVQLDPAAQPPGDYIAISWFAKRTPENNLSVRVTVWLVDAQGDAQTGIEGTGEPIVVDFKQNVVGSFLKLMTQQVIVKRVAGMLIGEPVPANSLLQWPVDVLESNSVRNAIAAARAAGGTIDVSF